MEPALDPRSGLASSGWAVGKVGFEVLLGVATGGSSAIKYGEKAGNLIKSIADDGIAVAVHYNHYAAKDGLGVYFTLQGNLKIITIYQLKKLRKNLKI